MDRRGHRADMSEAGGRASGEVGREICKAQGWSRNEDGQCDRIVLHEHGSLLMPPWSELAWALLGRREVSSTYPALRAQQMMQEEQQPALCSSAASPAPATAALRRFFFGTSSDGGAYARIDK